MISPQSDFGALLTEARWTAHKRDDLMRYEYRAGALRSALKSLASPPEGMERVMQRSALDLLAEIDAAESMMRGAA